MAINVKQMLADALISLVEEKPLSKITVTEIIRRAGTGRGTFYNHFRDKNDLIFWIFMRTLTGERALVETQGLYAYLVKLHREAQKVRRFLLQACRMEGQNSLSDELYYVNYRYYRNLIIERCGESVITDEIEFALQFNAYAAANMYIRWITDKMPASPEEQARMLLECMPKSIRDFLPLMGYRP